MSGGEIENIFALASFFALCRIKLIFEETEDFYRTTKVSPELCELRNIITCAYLTIKCAKIRKESRGLHFTTDYVGKLPQAYDTVL